MAMSGQNFSFSCSPTTQKLAMNKSHVTCTNVQTMDGSLFSTDFGYYIISTCACYFHLSISMISCDLHQVKALSGLKFLKGFPLVVMITSFPDNNDKGLPYLYWTPKLHKCPVFTLLLGPVKMYYETVVQLVNQNIYSHKDWTIKIL